jgi:hypothetical protein
MFFTTVYFRRTNHESKKHADSVKSKLLPIACWLQWTLLWISGVGDQILETQLIPDNYDNQDLNNSSDSE